MTSQISQPDEGFANPRLAALYDAECPWHPQDDFYQHLDLQAGSVLDVGCGTGTRLVSTRTRGHRGELVGVDPARAMLDIAGKKSRELRPPLGWILGDAQTLELDRRVELLTMTGHAFQVLLTDEDVRAALASFHRHLEPGGLLAFETRNPAAQAWQRWTKAHSRGIVTDRAGEGWETWVDDARTHERAGYGEEFVTFVSYNRHLASGELLTSISTLRFIDPEHLRALLLEAGFRIEGWFGDWDRSPVTPQSLEVIVLARR